MGFKCGLVGLPNAGKSTLFTALSGLQVERANFPFSTVEPNKAIVPVKDERLQEVAGLVGSQKITPAALNIIDIAGLIEGASKGEGLGNRFLAHIREMDLLLHVVRGFKAPGVPHVSGKMDPARDIEVINYELILADLALLEKKLEKLQRAAKSGSKEITEQLEFLAGLREHLNSGKMAKTFSCSPEEKAAIEMLELLTAKPVIYVVNIGEEELSAEDFEALLAVEAAVASENAPVISVCALLEGELQEMPPEEREIYMEEYGLKELGLNRIIKLGYDFLDLITFFTVKGTEARAWAVKKGTTARQGSGKVHSDMERGFIAAEVIFWEELIKAGSISAAREKGLIRLEGKDYLLKDGDVVAFRFKV